MKEEITDTDKAVQAHITSEDQYGSEIHTLQSSIRTAERRVATLQERIGNNSKTKFTNGVDNTKQVIELSENGAEEEVDDDMEENVLNYLQVVRKVTQHKQKLIELKKEKWYTERKIRAATLENSNLKEILADMEMLLVSLV